MDPSLATRLAEPFILSLLGRGPLHGYALLKALEEVFGEGALTKPRIYQILKRLREEGLVAVSEASGSRKEYTLTSEGEAHLAGLRDQRPEFFKELLMLFPGMKAELARASGNGGSTEATEAEGKIPRDGARSQLACPGCSQLRLSMERTLPEEILLIRVERAGQDSVPHLESCVVGLALRRLAASLLP
jgi:DNA-binding PadR family transcriptional regulator